MAGLTGTIEARQITYFDQVRTIHKTLMPLDFPADEIKTLDSMHNAWKSGHYICYGLFEKNLVVGYAFLAAHEAGYLLDYLAISSSVRNQHLGSDFLNWIAGQLREKCVLCEIEDPDFSETEEVRTLRERRKRFYLRNGYIDSSLRSSVFGVDFSIMYRSDRLYATEEIAALYSELYQILQRPYFIKPYPSIPE